jgi:hypothetical protein
MPISDSIEVRRLSDENGRQLALTVMRRIYRDEKNWVAPDEKLVSSEDLERTDVSWFIALKNGAPVGVVRVLYDPPLGLYAQYGFKMLDPGFDLDAFIRESRVAEIGRFAVLPECRRNFLVAASLMRAAFRETLGREFTHYVTDVFEGERHSPYEFHTRVIGFQPVATHDVGELNCPNRRITLILDLQAGYLRLRASKSWLFRYVTDGWPQSLHDRMERLPEVELA